MATFEIELCCQCEHKAEENCEDCSDPLCTVCAELSDGLCGTCADQRAVENEDTEEV